MENDQWFQSKYFGSNTWPSINHYIGDEKCCFHWNRHPNSYRNSAQNGTFNIPQDKQEIVLQWYLRDTWSSEKMKAYFPSMVTILLAWYTNVCASYLFAKKLQIEKIFVHYLTGLIYLIRSHKPLHNQYLFVVLF